MAAAHNSSRHLVDATSLHVMNPRTSGKGRGVASEKGVSGKRRHS